MDLAFDVKAHHLVTAAPKVQAYAAVDAHTVSGWPSPVHARPPAIQVDNTVCRVDKNSNGHFPVNYVLHSR
jgi:hypothetical protein